MLFQSIEASGDAAYVIGHIGEVIDRLDAIESAPAIDDNCKAVKLEHHNLEMHDVSCLRRWTSCAQRNVLTIS